MPEESGPGGGVNGGGTGLSQFSFQWWNGAIPLVAILGLLGLSRMKFGMSAEELKAILEARDQPAPMAPPRPAARTSAPVPSSPVAAAAHPGAPARGACLRTVNRIAPVAAEYTLLKDEISLGRGEENDLVIPHASISRTHARLMRRDGATN